MPNSSFDSWANRPGISEERKEFLYTLLVGDPVMCIPGVGKPHRTYIKNIVSFGRHLPNHFVLGTNQWVRYDTGTYPIRNGKHTTYGYIAPIEGW